MTAFDKICATLAIPCGLLLMALGFVGLFTGSKAHFTLPPVLGALPFFLGWAMSITLIRFWRRNPPSGTADAPLTTADDGPSDRHSTS